MPIPKENLKTLNAQILNVLFDEIEAREKRQQKFIAGGCKTDKYFEIKLSCANYMIEEIEQLIDPLLRNDCLKNL